MAGPRLPDGILNEKQSRPYHSGQAHNPSTPSFLLPNRTREVSTTYTTLGTQTNAQLERKQIPWKGSSSSSGTGKSRSGLHVKQRSRKNVQTSLIVPWVAQINAVPNTFVYLIVANLYKNSPLPSNGWYSNTIRAL